MLTNANPGPLLSGSPPLPIHPLDAKIFLKAVQHSAEKRAEPASTITLAKSFQPHHAPS